MDEQIIRTDAVTRHDRAGAGLVKRVVWGTVAAAGIVGAMAAGPGLLDDHVDRPAVATVAATQPMQPPVPPGPPVPPPMQEPGQEGPDSGIHGTPPPRDVFDTCADFVVVGGYPVYNANKPSRCFEA